MTWSFSGGDEEDRTLDLTDANRTLSQLSYAPNEFAMRLYAFFRCLSSKNEQVNYFFGS